ncbi:Hypothetical protein SMAX5B_019585 [Scophthalmus maximus]|uniref:Uncharacterized protein n=1 Tax=Scophthalmus maximus TaxID=52904 RepID=A0A2U9CTS2_SCOMX|nr:Hypothetical protein SMAX5B_019585 [Scophthalmus maximus]
MLITIQSSMTHNSLSPTEFMGIKTIALYLPPPSKSIPAPEPPKPFTLGLYM